MDEPQSGHRPQASESTQCQMCPPILKNNVHIKTHIKRIVVHTEVKEYTQRHLGRRGFCNCLGLEVTVFLQLQEHEEVGAIAITGLE